MLTLTLLSLLTMSAQEITVDSLNYTLNSTDHTATVSGYVEGITHANIPEFVEYNGQRYKVTALGNYCFWNCSGLTSIKIPDGVSTLGDWCFYGCSGLTSIKIPDGVTAIGDYCFRGCSGLTSINIPDGVTAIGNQWFLGCSGLTSIKIPDGVTALGKSCFESCSGLTSIKIPDGVTAIGENCFSRCSGLTSINIPDGVTTLGYQCFYGCSGLTSIKIPDGVTTLGDYCFGGCSGLTSIKISDGVTAIGNYCFEGCSSLTSIKIPDGVTALGNYCFWNCSGLTSIKIPDGVTALGDYCFKGCSSLTSIKIPDGVTALGGSCFSSCSSLTSINIPDGVTALEEGCFWNCSSLTSINIPDGVTALGKSCFWNCTSLTSINIPDSVTALGDQCFYGCSSLTSIKIPDGVTALGKSCFSFCSGLTSINIPDGVTALGDQCFHGVGTSSAPCKLYIDDQFVSQLLTKSGSYYTMAEGYFVVPVQSIRLSTSHLYLTKSQEFQQVTATAVPAAANNTGIKLTSGNTSVVSINDKDAVVIVGVGETDIRFDAVDGYGAYAVCHVKVADPTDSIKIDLSQKDLLPGQTFKPSISVYPATAKQVLKTTSSNPQVATVDSTGTVTAVGPGEADIRYEAFDNSEVFATLHVKVYAFADTIVLSEKELHLLVGDHYGKLKVSVLPATARQEWLVGSSNTSAAFVNEEHEIVATGWGECDIIYETTDGTKKTTKCHVYVTYPTDSITLRTPVLNTNPGEVFKAQQVNYYPQHTRLDLNYASSNEQVAKVDALTGAVTAVSVGEADIRYDTKDGTGKYAVMHVKVWPRTVSITPSTKTMSLKVGEQYDQQTVEILPSDAYPKLKLASEDNSVATVDDKGVITAVSPGVTNILYQAQDSSRIVAKCRVIVYAKDVVYVGGIYYKLNDEKTDTGEKKPAYATVTSIYGGENKGDDASKIAQYYSGTINIPKTVTYNGKTYPVTEVGSYSFYCQNSLQSIYIPSSVKTVSSNAAMLSTSLQLVTVEDNSQLVNIGSEAFEKCTALLRFTFNGTTLKMKSIDPSAFSECTALQRVRWKGESTLQMIDDYAFYRCSSLNHMEMPNSVVRIGKHAFRYNAALTDVTLAKQLSIIDEYAFGECGFSHITLPDSIASAQAGAFINNEHLTGITIPAAMEGIGAACFENNTALDSVTFLTNIHTLTVGNNAFNLCPALRRVNIAHLDSWAETNFNNAKANPANTAHHIYKDGKEVLDVVLPQGTQYVNNNAFNGCTFIKSVDMPSSIDHINDDIFVGCDSLTAVYCRAEDVPLFIGVNDPSAMSDVFNRATLYVPSGYESDYKEDTWWSRFYKMRSFDPTGISGITWHDDGQTRYYDLNGRPVGTRPTIQGVYIKVEHGKRTKVTVQ